MRENRFPALAVIHAAAGQIASDRHSQNYRRLEGAIRTPTHHAKFIANLHHGRPDIIEKLNLRDGLQPPRGHPYGAPYDAGLRERSIENAVAAVPALQSRRSLNDPPLAFDLLQVALPPAVANAFP